MKDKKAQILEMLMQFLSAFPTNNNLNGKGLAIYATVLQQYEPEQIQAAMLKILNTHKFFPSVAEIIEQIEAVTEYANGSALPSPDEAWNEAMRECHDKFVYGKWEFSAPEIEQAVKHFGKMAMCELTPEGMNTARAQFMRIYSAICERKKERKVNENVLKALPQRHVEMLVNGLAEKKAIGQ